MVLKGQFLERPTLIPVGNEVMEGLSHRGERRPPLLIVPPRPEEGGGMDHVVAAEVAWAAAMAGFPTLRFNFRGVGASQGQRGGTQAQLDELLAALRLAQENAATANAAVLTIGGSAWSALEVLGSRPGIQGLCLVSPVGVDIPEARPSARSPSGHRGARGSPPAPGGAGGGRHRVRRGAGDRPRRGRRLPAQPSGSGQGHRPLAAAHGRPGRGVRSVAEGARCGGARECLHQHNTS